MKEKGIVYSQWLEYIGVVKDKGIKSAEMAELAFSYPQVNMRDYQEHIYRELVKLENFLLSESIDRFQAAVNKCLSENDLEFLNRGIKNLKKEVSICFFYNKIEQYPQDMKEKLTAQMAECLDNFNKEFQRYIKQMEYYSNDIFVSDFCYICKKAKLEKMLRS